MNEIIQQNSKLKDITFNDIFNLNEIQNLQDLFADVHGVASIITDVKGNPLTKASNFSRLCETIIRKTEKGCANCYKSDAIIGKYNPEGATLQPCLSGGLLDAGASITVGGIHIANWLIGQVRNENIDEKILLQYADEIGVDRLEYKSALDEIPIMSVDKFKKIANLLFVIATDLSEKAFTNLQLKNEIAASNQAQQALEESKEKFALAFKTSPYAITITRPEDGMFIEVNDAFFSISGYTPEEALNNSSIGLDLWVDADDRNRVVKVLRDGGKVVGQEFQFKKKNGEIIIGFFSANLISINNSTYILSSINDITERKQTEIALKQSEEKYHELFEANKDGITIFNAYPDGRLSNFLEMNESAGAMLGYTKTELSTMNPSEIEIDVTEEKMGRRLNDLQTKGFSNFETILKHKNGSTVLVEITVLLINYNKFPALMNIVKDITEHKQSEIALKESEMRFKVLFDDAPDAMLLTDPETGKIIDANNKACSLFKKEKHEIIGLFQYELHPSQNEEQSKNTFIEHFENTGEIHNNEPVENKICCSDGTEIPVEIVGQAIHLNGKSLMLGTFRDITKRKLAEEETKKTEQHYQALIEKAPDGIALIDAEGNFKYISPSAKKMFGYMLTDEVKGNPAEYTHPDDLQLVLSELGKIFADPLYIPTIEYRYINKQGQWHWVETTFSNLLANPSVKSIVLNFRDITERKQNEEKLIKSEERYAIVIDASEQGIWDWNVETNEVFYSEQWKKQIGYKDDELKNDFETWIEHLHPEEAEYCQNAVNLYLNNPIEHFILEFKFRHKDGTYRWIHNKAASLKNNEGKVIRMFGSHTDITERKQTEIALKQNEEKFRNFFENTIVGMSITSIDGNLTVNNAFCKIVGYSETELNNLNWKEITHLDDIELNNKIISSILKGEKQSEHWEKRYIHKDGHIVWVDINTAIQRDDKANPLYFITAVIDITKRKNAEEELIKAKEKAEESEEKYRLLFENANEAIYIVQNEKLVFANPACEQLTEISKDNLIGFSILDLVDVYDKENLSKHHHDLINGITQNQNSYFTIINQKGEKRHLSVNSVLINWNGLPATLNFATDITERKNAELGLKVKEKEYRNLIEFSPIAMSIIHDWKTIYFNPAAIELFGAKTQDELIGKHIYELIHPDFHNLALENSKLLAENGFVAMQEQKYLKLDGTVLIVETQAKSIRFNNLPATLVVINDITERKQSEQALRESEERYKALHNASFGGIAIHDKGKIFECNQGLSEITGYSYNELIGMDGLMLIAPESRNLVLSNILSNYEKPYEAIGLRKNGEEFPLRLAGKNIPYKGKTFRTVEFRDITERKYLEKIHEIQYKIASAVVASDNIEQLLEFVRIQLSQLTNTENFFAALYNAQSNTLKKLHWVDEVDSFDEWDAASSFSGYVVKTAKALLINKQEIAKISIEQNIPILGEPAECWLGAPLIVEKKVIGVLVIQSYKDPMAYNASFGMLFEQLAQDLSVFIHKTTILNELKIANFHAQESDRLKSAFLANMSHEIRTPMNGILGFAELLKEPNLSGQQQQEYIRIIEKSGNRMLNIINDIVDISKIEAGLMKLDIKETNINEQIEYIYNFFKPEAEAKGLKLTFSTLLPAKESIVKTDREKVYAILTNLVKNAIKYTNVGTIEIGYSLVDYNQVETKHDRFVLIFYVKDTGIGIPKDKHEAIFERFIQADIACKMAYQGAGLGLSITKAYVEMLGGKIWVESEEEIGSTFYFTLPYNQKQQRKPEIYKSESLKKWDKIRKLKILIAEDDEISEMLIEITVNAFSKETFKARTGIEAIEACKMNPDIDLVLMDIQMPKMGGYEATRQIRNFNKNVIIIAQTAFVLSGDRHKAIEAGCNDYIAKPINKDELLMLIQKYFG